MAQSTPNTTPPAVRVTVESFLAKWRQRFRDNDQFLIAEADLREHDADMSEVFVPYSKLTVNIIRGNHLLLGTLSELPTVDSNVLVVGQPATVANATDAATAAAGVEAGVAEFRLLRDSQGPLWAYVDPRPATTQRVRVTWVRTSGSDEDIVASYPPFQVEDFRYKPGDVFQYTYEDGATLLHQVNDPAPTTYVNPLPSGKSDAHYTLFAPLPAATLYQLVLTKAALAQMKGLTPGLQYRLTERGYVEPTGNSGGGLVDLEPLPDVVVTAGSNRRFLPEAFSVPAGASGPFTPVHYDQDADAISPRQTGSGGGSPIVDWYNDTDVPAGTTVSIYGQLYRAKTIVPAGQDAPPYYEGWVEEWERLRAGADDDTQNQLSQLNYWYNKPFSSNDSTTIPNYISSRLYSYVPTNSPRLLPQAAGVLAWRDGVPAGYFATLAAAADYCYQLDQPGTATVLFQVYGTVGTPTTNQYVKQSATVQLMAGSKLVAALFACQYSNEYQPQRIIRIVGEGELVANIDNYAFGAGLRLEVECAKWTGQLHHNTGGSYPRCEYWFRGVKISSKGAPTALIKYRYGNYYQTNAFVWLDGCTVENTEYDLLVVQGTNNGTGAGPGETDGNNLLRLTKTTVYLAAGKVLANQAAGTVVVEQPAEGGTGSPAPAFFIAANEYNTTPAHPEFTSAETAARWMLQYWNNSGGTVPPPAAPQLLAQDDTANYIEWQKDASLAASAYEVTMDAGDSWAPANSGTVVNGRIRVSVSSGQVGIGVVGLRLKATTSTPASAWSFNTLAFDFADYLRNSRFQDGDNGTWTKGSGAVDITISAAGVVFASGSSLAEISQSLPGNTFENGKNYVLLVEGSGTGSFRMLANVDYGGWAPSSLDFNLNTGSARLEMTLNNNAQHNSYYYLQRLSGGGTITRVSLLATA